MDGDRAAHRHAEQSGGLGIEVEILRGFIENPRGQACLADAVGGDGGGMIAMSGHVGNDAAETGGAKSLGNGQVVFLPAFAAMNEDERADDLGGGFQHETACGELLADLGSAVAEISGRIGRADKAGCAVAGGEFFDLEPVGRRV